ncbi:hypothetical protein [Persicobacter sp. CCB-QB2]|uniref:hypothetical protein n=1 Tax=Persicobacter sp. CCB-QB2 TaxID=1561025 RepID=UPI0006A9D291|nr:hypothetical protein [Persicobacter sp. CCB-QB2]
MIALYLNIAEALSEIPALKFIDMKGGEDPNIFPAALVSFDPLNHEQLPKGSTQADIRFTVNVKFSPYLRSEGKGTPKEQLLALREQTNVIEIIKSRLVENDVEGIFGIMLAREHAQKKGTDYEVPLTFYGRVEWSPDTVSLA